MSKSVANDLSGIVARRKIIVYYPTVINALQAANAVRHKSHVCTRPKLFHYQTLSTCEGLKKKLVLMGIKKRRKTERLKRYRCFHDPACEELGSTIQTPSIVKSEIVLNEETTLLNE
ncbi:hypothetical protein AVEN_48894-1 [Araneus ventricosus]|uniref:Uncharacterized protein n=1 Tax=Araneus ventricosus TaxID=182803 RepID=A0A4Y2AGE3_ARAVE|nr:hypothetical protein AVEN_48894-1 [Araneus ventricosus]